MMGEMIENIAHQWRQPLSALSLINSNIYMFYELGELDDAFMKKSLAKTELLTQSMSETIDDFKNFFKVKKTKKNFSLEESVRKTVHLAQSTLDHHQIKITYEQTTGYSGPKSSIPPLPTADLKFLIFIFFVGSIIF